MTASASKRSNKPLIAVVAALLAIAAIAAIWFFIQKKTGAMVTDLYRYYPQQTVMYLEFSPGDKMSSRLVGILDRLSTMGAKPGQASPIRWQPLVEKNFKPYFSVGAWPRETAASGNTGETAQASARPVFLAIFPLKNGVKPETALADLQLSPEAFTTEKVDDATLYVPKSGARQALAFHRDNLLVADEVAALRQALSEEKTPQTFLDNPDYKEHLDLLEVKREGTLLLHTAHLQAISDAKALPGTTPKLGSLEKVREQLQAVTPVMVGNIRTEDDEYLHFDGLTPVNWQPVQNAELKKDLQNLFTSQANLNVSDILPQNTALYVSMFNLGNYYDLYAKYFATPDEKNGINNINTQLKLFRLDFRKNLVALLDGKVGLAVSPKPGIPDVVLFLNGTEDTRAGLDQLGAFLAQGTGGHVSEKTLAGSQKITVLASPAAPVAIAYGLVQPNTLAVGMESALAALLESRKDAKNALSGQSLFKELMEDMPEKQTGLFYVNVTQLAGLLEQLAASQGQAAQNVREALRDFEGVAGYNTVSKQDLIKSHLTLKLAKAS